MSFMGKCKETFCLEEATIALVHRAMKKGCLSCRRLVEMYLERIEAYDQKDPALNSVIFVNPRALEIADELDVRFKESGFKGPLHGIPVLLKDNIDTVDMPTTGGSLSLEGVVPRDDALITTRVKKAGALILAKVNLHEFAVWGETVSSIMGQTLNPYDLTRSSGGSNGGTGAGIAANFGMVGIGTDTINSIRSPSSACCLVGFRATLGLVSRDGIIPYSLTQDMAGPLARTAEDAAKVLDVIAGYDPDDAATAWAYGNIPETYTQFLDIDGLKGARIGVLRSFFGTGQEHREVNHAINQSIDIMAQRGAEVIELEEPIDANKLVSEVSVHLYDLKRDLDIYLKDLDTRASVNSLADVIDSGRYHPGIEENIKHAATLSTDSVEYKDRFIKRAKLQQQVMKLMADNRLDVIVFPHQKILVVPVGASQVERNGVLGSVTGFPAFVVPGGFSQPTDTAPIGLEMVGRPWSEPTLIRIVYAFEQATKFRRPPASTPSF